jgi:copper chaperone CopZ
MKRNLILIVAICIFSFGQAQAEYVKTTTTNVVSFANKDKNKTLKLKITGMTCAGCSNHVSNALKDVDGVIDYTVQYPENAATIQYNPEKINPKELIEIIEKTGYKAEVIKEKTKK